MPQEKILGDQINIIDVTLDISMDTSAIGNIADGLTTNGGAIATLSSVFEPVFTKI